MFGTHGSEFTNGSASILWGALEGSLGIFPTLSLGALLMIAAIGAELNRLSAIFVRPRCRSEHRISGLENPQSPAKW